MTIHDFINMVRDAIFDEYAFHEKKTDEELIQSLWTGTEPVTDILLPGQLTELEASQQERVMWSLWSLIQQHEYLFLQYFSENQFLPYILGTCGHVYAMEYAPSTPVLDPDMFHVTGMSSFSWHQRVKVALELLDLMQSARDQFHEPLHFCDVKGSNFGIAQNGKVKPIDTDTVFFQSKLEQVLGGTESCSTDADCSFFDCLGHCDVASSKCGTTILNNNLQVGLCTSAL